MDFFTDPGLGSRPTPPSLEDHETILDQVWMAEREQDLIRRIENACRVEDERQKSLKRKGKKGGSDPTAQPSGT
jgi:hypothetical protein